MDTIRAMRYFVRAVELRSLSAVAREEGSQQPHISKVLRGLEAELGVRLLERSTTGLTLTEPGQRFYARALLVLAEFGQAVAAAQGATEQAAGLLRVNAPVAFGQLRLNALVQQFLARYPQVQLELILNDHFVDLVEQGVDVALRLGSILPPTAVARSLGTSARLLVASPAYLAARGAPLQPEQLAEHDYVRFAWAPRGDLVDLTAGSRTVTVATNGRFRVNNAVAIRDSLAAGAGIGLCPVWLVEDLLASGALVTVLPAWRGENQQLSLLMPSRRYRPLRTTLFIEFMAGSVAEMKGFQM
ncbi:LysR family transcriptional regulator [Massilia sp. S19_KUP03_FR1]|uniref:LysR family transcriptional regulator n=1 Tax=Massilia sp. S19_KUP03_FR1 TaxID=3025503 RepID=UPI002FCCDA35